ncbi:SusC/RagA family TonB-linked outer membrane protein [Siphonobacter aquaeclarae]|uniref:TonB-linked outer membrane protein, SusC/RagA family n=1 Tax=Siphonobacter aquaeclarae TaxID=563176 RepID=A0A1G9W1F1_9BACT|nr:TonB-dependent receptor [Siphonobacter aquaeclarae]SDM78358.1 TonB-linked outer membrane protein, SusC/RagA family [Siphonobacter aquaeclarae]
MNQMYPLTRSVSRKLSLLLLLTLLFHLAQAADITVTGIVRDASSGDPAIGVTVKVKGTSTGTITGTDGRFSLRAPDNGTLVFSSIGYESVEVPVNGQTSLTVSIKPSAQELAQVVVVGYGTQRKVDVTGATVTIKGEDLFKQPVMTATQAMQGKVAGVQIISSGQPGSSPVIRVRGTGTALAGTAALFVVDGVLTDDIANINTADIVNVDVLKDASATAIYGSRGANGVVIITTKKGAAGKMSINYTVNAGVRSAANLVKMANAAEYANYVSAASGNLVQPGTVSTDWYGQILRQGFQQNHNLSISGGSEKGTYFLSLGYLTDQGIVIDNQYKRLTLRSNNEYKLSEKLKAGVTASYSNGDNQIANLGSAYNNAYRAAPIIPAKVGGRYGNTSVYQNVGNAVLDIENNNNNVKDNRLQGAAYLEYKPVTWLTFRSSMGADWINTNGRVYNYKFENDTVTFLSPGGNQRNPNSNLSFKNEKTLHWTWDNTVTFNRTFGRHTITALAGTTAEQFTYTWFTAFRKDVPAAPNLWYIGTGNANTSTNDGNGDKWSRNSYIGRLNYNYDDTYLLTATLRADGSSRFPKNNRWGYFPSVGVGWVISNENFLKGQNLFQTLKLRASWGRVGNDRIPSDAFTVTVTPNLAYPFGGGIATPGSAVTQIKDPNLKWETTEETDFAVEFSALKGRLTGEIGYYNKKASDLLINVKVPSVSGDGDGVVLTNAASIRNQGLEVMLNWRGKITEDLSYRIGGNLTLNKNSVIGLNGGQPILDGGIGAAQQYTTRTDNGQPVGSFYVLKVLGVFQTDDEVAAYKNAQGTVIQPSASAGSFKYQDTNGDGKIDDNDRVFAGAYQPKAYFGVNGGITYKSFDLSFDIYGNVGNQVYNGKKAFRQAVTDNVERSMAYGRWTPGSGIQNEPAANAGNLPASTYYLESGSFVRLNNVTLGYALPETVLKRLGISTIRVFATLQNIYTNKKYSGFTSELPGDPTKSGIELNAYPTTKTIAFGLNLGF